MNFQRTPEARFENLADYPFSPNYANVQAPDGTTLRMHYIDEGPRDGALVLCLHGQPTWSYLYRKMIPLLVAQGFRVVAPDLIGFGRSDKPNQRDDYTYANHVAWLRGLLEEIDLTDITMFCQDWGGLIGLRVAAENSARFSRIVVANTGLPDAASVPDGQHEAVGAAFTEHYQQVPVHQNAAEMAVGMATDPSPMRFQHWVKFCSETPRLQVSDVMGSFKTDGGLSTAELAAYDAPFPDDSYMAGARQFPTLVPIRPDNVAVPANRAAWAVLQQWDKPLLTTFSDSDPVTAGGDLRFQKDVPGAQGQPHTTIAGAGHFLQEEAAAELAEAIGNLIRRT